MEKLTVISQICACITGIAAVWFLIMKPLKRFFTDTAGMLEGQKCLLRSAMLHTYYKNREVKTIRQYEYQNFLASYKAYKVLHGNSFIDRIRNEIATWEVVK